MKKISAALIIILLFILTGYSAKNDLPRIRDTLRYARRSGNSTAAEQDHFYALRGKNEKDEVGMLLYDKETKNSQFLFADNVYQIGLIGNKIYYRVMYQDGLFCYALDSGKRTLLLEDFQIYQIKDQSLYYTSKDSGKSYYMKDLQTGAVTEVKTENTVDSFWITDTAFYYTSDTERKLYRRPNGKEEEQLIYSVDDAAILNVTAITGDDIAFLSAEYYDDEALLLYCETETGKVYPQIKGDFENFGYVRIHGVTVKGSDIYAVDFEAGEVYSWGKLDQVYDYFNVMEDQIIFYKDDHPYIQDYPETANAR